ncbi:hypothetical protein PUR29_35195 [Methylobacterium ajmalii]|uniref:Methyl-accepting transducer domain-containing protein n=1 Tax=Methylobacterium ajmalii TaxID=2738439 RepID=A0ABV0A4B9_9HYPH
MTTISNCNVNMHAAPDERTMAIVDLARAAVENAKAVRANAEALSQIVRSVGEMKAPITAGFYVVQEPREQTYVSDTRMTMSND